MFQDIDELGKFLVFIAETRMIRKLFDRNWSLLGISKIRDTYV